MTLPEKFRTVVTATQAVVLDALQDVNPTIEQINFDYGSAIKVIDRLILMNKPQSYQYKKYPLVALLDRVTVDEGKSSGLVGTWRPRIVIVNQLSGDKTDKERYEQNITPILTVVYEELMRQIARSRYFTTLPRQPHKLDILPFWGKDGLYGNINHTALDELDCLQITQLELGVRPERVTCLDQPFKNF